MYLTIETDDRDEAIAILSGIDPRDSQTTQVPAEDGRDQAIDYFMDERQDLRRQLGIVGAAYRDLSRECSNLSLSEREALTELGEARIFVEKAERLLAGIGISVDSGEIGEPKLSVNIDELLNFVRAQSGL